MYISKRLLKQNNSEEEDKIDSEIIHELPKILIIGVGGAGNNCIDRISIKDYSCIKKIALNTDSQQLNMTEADVKVLIGTDLTHGLGAGGDPKVGKVAAKASEYAIKSLIKNVELIFMIAGMGGGTGTGATPIIAEIAKSMGIIVIGIVTTPFRFEKGRKRRARQGLRELSKVANSILVIDNNKLLGLFPEENINSAFENINSLIAEIISGITETITTPSLINLDFADIKTIMSNGNLAMMYYGQSSTLDPNEIVRNTLNNPLLDSDYHQANGALIHITGGANLSLELTNEITKGIAKKLKPKANIILGARINPEFENEVKLLTIMTGFNSFNLENRSFINQEFSNNMNKFP